jgi:hypothetical protein
MSFPPATEMFQFAGFASRTYGFSTGYPLGWVAPFGDPGINDRSHLPRAFRSVPRPSSPLSAKASTRCPSLALLATPNGKRHESLARPKFDLGRALLAVSAPGLTRGPSSRLSNPEVLTPRGSGGPSPSVQQTLFSPEDTLCGIGHDRPRARQRSPTQTCTSKPNPPGTRHLQIPLRSHNSLLYDCHQQHTLAAPLGVTPLGGCPSQEMPAKAIPLFSPRSSRCTGCRRLSEFAFANSCRRATRSACRWNLRFHRWWR